jgi:hypothetical protein
MIPEYDNKPNRQKSVFQPLEEFSSEILFSQDAADYTNHLELSGKHPCNSLLQCLFIYSSIVVIT